MKFTLLIEKKENVYIVINLFYNLVNNLFKNKSLKDAFDKNKLFIKFYEYCLKRNAPFQYFTKAILDYRILNGCLTEHKQRKNIFIYFY